jgi:MFS family permease
MHKNSAVPAMREWSFGMGQEREFYGWKLVAALWVVDLINMGFPVYGGAILNKTMLHDIAMSRTMFGTANTILNFFFGVPSLIIAAIIVRWGVRATFMIGSVLLLGGALWMALVVSQPWHFLLGFGPLIGIGVGFGTIVPMSTVLARWFKRYRGRAMGISMTASGVAGFIAAPFTNAILSSNGSNWRQAWLLVGSLILVSGLIAFLFVKERPEDLGQKADGLDDNSDSAGAPLPGAREGTARLAYKSPNYWFLVIGSFACQFPFFFTMGHWVLHLEGLGLSASVAAWALGIYTGSSVAGRLIGGWLADRMSGRLVLILGTCGTLAGAIFAIRSFTPALAFFSAALMGCGFGWTFIALNAVVADYYGPDAFPRLMGMLFVVSAMVCCPAGLIGGWLFDLYQSYTPAYLLVIGICIACMVVLASARKPQPLSD